MKKHVLIATALFVGMGLANAQTPAIPNGNLESWTPLAGEEEPTGGFLKSLNQILVFPGNPPATCFKEGNAHGGQFCAKLVSKNFSSLGIFIPGALGTLTPIAQPISAQLAEPYAAKPESVRAWIKYTPVTGDSAEVFSYLFKTTGGVRDTIARASQKFTQAVANWTEITVPFTYSNNNVMPDSASLIFIASAGYNFQDLQLCFGSQNSTLYVDDVEFVYPASINEFELGNNDISMYPNPAENVMNISVSSALNNGIISITDMNGREVMSSSVNGEQFSVNVAELKAGNYIAIIKEGKTILGRKTFVKK